MKPVARDIDTSICSKHKNVGPGRLGSPDVRVNGAGALTASNGGTYPACEHSEATWRLTEGAATVFVNRKELAWMGGRTIHPHSPGLLASGSPDVLVGGPAIDVRERARRDALVRLDAAEMSLLRWNEEDREHFRKWFGPATEKARAQILAKIRATRRRAESAAIVSADGDGYAYVHRDDSSAMYVEEQFWNAEPEGYNSQAGVIVHEASHYADTANTHDHEYGQSDSSDLAHDNPARAKENADSIEYYVEGLSW